MPSSRSPSKPLISAAIRTCRSEASNIVTATAGYAITSRYRFVVEALNLLNAKVSDIDYFYASRLPGEPAAGVNDIHTHPVEPRPIRLRFEATF